MRSMVSIDSTLISYTLDTMVTVQGWMTVRNDVESRMGELLAFVQDNAPEPELRRSEWMVKKSALTGDYTVLRHVVDVDVRKLPELRISSVHLLDATLARVQMAVTAAEAALAHAWKMPINDRMEPGRITGGMVAAALAVTRNKEDPAYQPGKE